MPAKKKYSAPVRKAAIKSKEHERPEAGGDFPIVGIGASAGGLETLQVFFSKVPANVDIAFVIIQHLSPKYKSIMAELLAKHTPLSVRQIEDGMRVLPGCVFLNPPDKNVAIFNRSLHLMGPIKASGINMPIDFFFRSLSEDQKERAIGIIVSGTASDGTLGIKAIKGEGGMAMAEDPDTAKYDGMPRSAVATGLIDFIVPVETMPQTLLEYIKHPFLSSPGKIKLSEAGTQQQLNKIFALIRSATGHDFSKYKPNTIQRRIERRLAVHQLEKLSDYVIYLQKTPSEAQAVFKDLLIGVTSFFRDPEAFKVLGQQGLEKLLQNKKANEPLRCWVVGCATGEEAYSLAMLFVEAMEQSNKHLDVQIFASDIDALAIETARRGVYPDSIATDVSKERLSLFFTREQGAFKVKKKIRDMIVFSEQSIIKDPPFSKMDLVSCRNLLIYLDVELQKKIITLLHYALNPKGVLFLGSAESIGEFGDLFEPLDGKLKIYQRKAGNSHPVIGYPTGRGPDDQAKSQPEEASHVRRSFDLRALAEKTVLDQYAPAAVLINDKYDILHFVGRTEKYLVPPTGKPSFNLLNMARLDLKFDLTAGIHQAKSENKRTTRKGIRVEYNGTFCIVDLSVSPLPDKGELPPGHLLVVFEDRTSAHPADDAFLKASRGKTKEPKARQLEQDLNSTREYLRATIEELETSNEELQSTNEELQSVNEELQSANEELETSKEELQSTNEELNTVNTELQNKVHELSRTSDDMNNLLTATGIASIFLDIRLCIKRYTAAAARIIKLIPTDIDRPLNDLKTSFPKVDLAQKAQSVLDDLNTFEMQIESEDHIQYQVKAMPYRTAENVIDGVVMTFINIQPQFSQAESKLRRFATVLEDSNDAIMVQDFEGRILAWNKGAEEMYGWTEAEALKMNAADLLPKDKQNEFQTLADTIKRGETVRSLQTRRKSKTGRILDTWLTITLLTDKNGRPVQIATTERDLAWLTERA
ncbi:MAG: PAS domain S-box protein [Desulfobacteraceae bacterium]|nr:MAG: PAS domain S-box protein [Desulfobacteraceae bacterium]